MLQVQQSILFQCVCSFFIADCLSLNVARDKYVAFFFIVSKRYYCKSFPSRQSVTTWGSLSQFFLGAQCFCAIKNVFCQLFKDSSISLVFCFIVSSITFINLSSNGFCYISVFHCLYDVKIWLMLSRVFLVLAGWCNFQMIQSFYKLWSLEFEIFALDPAHQFSIRKRSYCLHTCTQM